LRPNWHLLLRCVRLSPDGRRADPPSVTRRLILGTRPERACSRLSAPRRSFDPVKRVRLKPKSTRRAGPKYWRTSAGAGPQAVGDSPCDAHGRAAG
jgi:hypothetical protein